MIGFGCPKVMFILTADRAVNTTCNGLWSEVTKSYKILTSQARLSMAGLHNTWSIQLVLVPLSLQYVKPSVNLFKSDKSRLLSSTNSLRSRNNREPGWQFKSPATTRCTASHCLNIAVGPNIGTSSNEVLLTLSVTIVSWQICRNE